MEIIDPKRTKERMDERLEMMHRLYSDSEMKHFFSPSEPMTNADRIRAMVDEELATWIYMNRWNDIESLLEWLKQEGE